ncbi:Uncharacterized protein OBRU01_16934 [Operophtera brumata]|uniref:C2H2-type domain-containing protein n=1 Tax=Operophtera brumata TaxID=104452 RepID=A0A0L7KZT1_OPEBR|nr:Uncharacterized protein OBRU01_16934 [Operophtera brumata]
MKFVLTVLEILKYSNRSKSGLHNHNASAHETARAYCAACRAHFRTRTGLAHHLRTHSAHLTPHNKKRSNPRRQCAITSISCTSCGGLRETRSTFAILRCHIRTHTGERPLSCMHCDATFAHSAALYTHNKILHKHKPR